MDSTEEAIQSVLDILNASKKEAWLKDKEITQIQSKENKLNKKSRKKAKAENFRKNRIQVK